MSALSRRLSSDERRAHPTAPVLFATMVALAMLLIATAASAQTPPPPAAEMTEEYIAAVVDSTAIALVEAYVYNDVALEMEKRIRDRLADGAYDDLGSPMELAQVITEDLRDVSGDRHISIRAFPPEVMQEMVTRNEDPEVGREARRRELERQNFYFREVSILAGNIGYLRMDQLPDASFAGPTAVAAMNFLGHSDALIMDLRYNGGGSPSLIMLLFGYLFDGRTNYNDWLEVGEDCGDQHWSLPYVPGPSLGDVPVYVLTSGYTFSGAEDISYSLQSLGRATIIGETTGGGAHPVNGRQFPSLNIIVGVPFAYARNPITGGNWEGTGVIPDINVPADDALDTAHREALRAVIETTEDEEYLAELEWAADGLDAQLNPVALETSVLERYAGTYGERQLRVEDGQLLYRRGDGPERVCTPMGEALFYFEGLDFFRLEVVLDESGVPTKLIGHYRGRPNDESPRTD